MKGITSIVNDLCEGDEFMNRVILVLLCTFLAFSITACAEEGTTPISSEEEIESEIMTLDPKEAQLLKKAHPDCFGLDTREGLNVLVFKNGQVNSKSVWHPGTKRIGLLKKQRERLSTVHLHLKNARKCCSFIICQTTKSIFVLTRIRCHHI